MGAIHDFVNSTVVLRKESLKGEKRLFKEHVAGGYLIPISIISPNCQDRLDSLHRFNPGLRVKIGRQCNGNAFLNNLSSICIFWRH